MRIAAIVVAVGLVTCSESVRFNNRAHEVEFMSHEYTGKHGYKCDEVGQISVQAIPAEVSAEKGIDVLGVKMKNEARAMGATHVLRWPSSEWPCNKAGEDDPKSERECSKADATAYVCMVGRGT